MYIHLHTIYLIGVTELVQWHVICTKSASISLVDFSVDIAARKNIFG